MPHKPVYEDGNVDLLARQRVAMATDITEHFPPQNTQANAPQPAQASTDGVWVQHQQQQQQQQGGQFNPGMDPRFMGQQQGDQSMGQQRRRPNQCRPKHRSVRQASKAGQFCGFVRPAAV
jgi:hypothetical protein